MQLRKKKDMDEGDFNMKNSEVYKEEMYNRACLYYEKKEYDKALNIANKLLTIDKQFIPARNLKASILIDAWDGDEKTEPQIKEAVDHLEILLENDSENEERYLYNLGNAYYKMAIAELKRNSGKLNENIIEKLERAKDYFTKCLKINDERPKAWINKGNALDHLGRYLEAIECFDRAILVDSKHYNAWGNRGIAFWRLSNKAEDKEDKSKLFREAMTYLAIELVMHPDFEIEDELKEKIKTFIRENEIPTNLESLLKEQLPKKKALLGEHFNLHSSLDTDFKTFYYDFSERHSLFLNLHFDCNGCEYSRLDLLTTHFLVPINESERPYELFKRWYNILDDYKTARFLLSLSHFRHKDFTFLDKERFDPPDYSLSYISNVELLKTAFLITMNLYDKVAFFLKEYENLELKDENVNFWGRSIFNQTFLKKNDWQIDLVALDSIRRDLEKKEFKRWVDIRNYITHRYFVLHDVVDVDKLTYPYGSNIPLKHKEYHMDINEFFNITISALRNMRNVLFSLAFFISQKEKLKKKKLMEK